MFYAKPKSFKHRNVECCHAVCNNASMLSLIMLCAIRLYGIRLYAIRFYAIRLYAIRLYAIRLYAIRLYAIRLHVIVSSVVAPLWQPLSLKFQNLSKKNLFHFNFEEKISESINGSKKRVGSSTN
jgi:hypothetical protein